MFIIPWGCNKKSAYDMLLGIYQRCGLVFVILEFVFCTLCRLYCGGKRALLASSSMAALPLPPAADKFLALKFTSKDQLSYSS